MAAEANGAYPTSGDFHALLDWHMRRGTRPGGTPHRPGVAWEAKALSRELALNDRTIRDWRRGAYAPGLDKGPALTLAFFGDAACYDDWRSDLTAAINRANAPPAPEAVPPAPDLPAPGPCLGREDRIAELLALLVPQDSRAVTALILGGPGYGKTLLTETVAAHADIAARFGPRRWFLRLETVRSARDIEVTLAAALGLDPQARFDAVARRLAEAPVLMVLDNLETPWDADRAGTEALLLRLTAVPGLALMASVRGSEPPDAPWSRTLRLRPLPEPVARELFLSVAGGINPDDPGLAFFLDGRTGVLGGIPLAVRLVALRAALLEGNPLASLRRRWEAAGVALAERLGTVAGRLDSVSVSIGFSLESPRLGAEGRRLFALLGLAPAGLAEADAAALPGADWLRGGDQLRAVGLLAPGERCDLLPPLRDFARRAAPPVEADEAAWRRSVLDLLCREADRLGMQGGAEAVQRLLPELPNLEAALDSAIRAAKLRNAATWANSLGFLFAITGFGGIAPLDRLARACTQCGEVRGAARATFNAGYVAFYRSDHAAARERFEAALPLTRAAVDVPGEANCIRSLGDIALMRSDHTAARERYEAALPRFRAAADVQGEANCIRSLGDIALARSDHAAARERFETALAQYRSVGDLLGEANCIHSLGQIALERSDYAPARERFKSAMPLYRAVGDVLGEANCIRRVGDIALACSDHAAAGEHYEAALPLYRAVGDMLGEAACILGLGEIALRRSDHAAARERTEAALPLYRAVSDVLDEANCIQRLGDIARAEGDNAAAAAAWAEALALYQSIAEPYSIGCTHERLAGLAEGDARAEHLAAARAAWLSIERADLVATLPLG